MEYTGTISLVIIAIDFYNVWLLRYGQSTQYRGGNASNMKEECEVYGLPSWSVNVVGAIKLIAATLLLIGIYFETLVMPAAITMIILMPGAFAMHLRIRAPFQKIPAGHFPARSFYSCSFVSGIRKSNKPIRSCLARFVHAHNLRKLVRASYRMAIIHITNQQQLLSSKKPAHNACGF